MKPISVSDLNANYEENLERWSIELSRSQRCLKVFEALYTGRKQTKSVKEISEESGLEQQAVRDAGHRLRGLGLCGHEAGTKGERAFLYTRIPHVSALRDRIARLARNPSRLGKIPTKRRQGGASPAVFSKSYNPRSKAGNRARARRVPGKLRVVLLATNPDADLRTDIEMRDIASAVRRTNFKDDVEFRHAPAARLSDLLSELNEFRPHVIHFSGHGGSQALVFEGETAPSGGMDVDYDLVADFLEATDTPPKVLVLNACATYEGADIFLKHVEVVVAMLDTIDDAAAGYFSVQFYTAICSGQSIASALRQGKAVLKAGRYKDADLPKAIARSDIDLSSFKLLPGPHG